MADLLFLKRAMAPTASMQIPAPTTTPAESEEEDGACLTMKKVSVVLVELVEFVQFPPEVELSLPPSICSVMFSAKRSQASSARSVKLSQV